MTELTDADRLRAEGQKSWAFAASVGDDLTRRLLLDYAEECEAAATAVEAAAVEETEGGSLRAVRK